MAEKTHLFCILGVVLLAVMYSCDALPIPELFGGVDDDSSDGSGETSEYSVTHSDTAGGDTKESGGVEDLASSAELHFEKEEPADEKEFEVSAESVPLTDMSEDKPVDDLIEGLLDGDKEEEHMDRVDGAEVEQAPSEGTEDTAEGSVEGPVQEEEAAESTDEAKEPSEEVERPVEEMEGSIDSSEAVPGDAEEKPATETEVSEGDGQGEEPAEETKDVVEEPVTEEGHIESIEDSVKVIAEGAGEGPVDETNPQEAHIDQTEDIDRGETARPLEEVEQEQKLIEQESVSESSVEEERQDGPTEVETSTRGEAIPAEETKGEAVQETKDTPSVDAEESTEQEEGSVGEEPVVEESQGTEPELPVVDESVKAESEVATPVPAEGGEEAPVEKSGGSTEKQELIEWSIEEKDKGYKSAEEAAEKSTATEKPGYQAVGSPVEEDKEDGGVAGPVLKIDAKIDREEEEDLNDIDLQVIEEKQDFDNEEDEEEEHPTDSYEDDDESGGGWRQDGMNVIDREEDNNAGGITYNTSKDAGKEDKEEKSYLKEAIFEEVKGQERNAEDQEFQVENKAVKVGWSMCIGGLITLIIAFFAL